MGQLTRAAPVDYLEVMAAERQELLGLLATLDAGAWDLPTECPAWSVKGIVLHLLGDDLSLLSRQRDGAPSGTGIVPGSSFDELFVLLDRFNERWVEAAMHLGVPLLLDLLHHSGAWSHDWYATVDPDRAGESIAWVGPDPAPYWLLGAREYLERWVHHNQIRRAIGQGPLAEARWVHPAAGTAVRGFPLGFTVLPASPGTEISLAIEGGAAWTLAKGADTWTLYDGAAEDPAVMLRLDLSTAAQVFSRGLGRGEVGERVRPDGDQQLATLLAGGLAAFFGR
jgi:uncharacterized protein (TIGR03083 family)